MPSFSRFRVSSFPFFLNIFFFLLVNNSHTHETRTYDVTTTPFL